MNSLISISNVLLLAAVLIPRQADAKTARLRVFPELVRFYGERQKQSLLGIFEKDGMSVGLAGDLRYESADPAVAEVSSAGEVSPKGNGSTHILILSNNETARVRVDVSGWGKPDELSFTRHVLPALTKANCNSGGCHGALAGKGGFRLSLSGYDPSADHIAITRDAGGRRVESSDPLRSLLLTKPTVASPHKGGRRLNVRSEDYRLLAEWIAAGSPASKPSEAPLTELEIVPANWRLQKGGNARLMVRAHYADGVVEDVTRWSKFTSTDETVAKVTDPNGGIEVIGWGEGAISAWFSSRIVMSRITSPYQTHGSPESKSTAKIPQSSPNLIDKAIDSQLHVLSVPSSPPADDSTFVRRAFLDVIGVLPTPKQTAEFLQDASPQKRSKLIDVLLERPEYTDRWASHWADLFLVSGRHLRPEPMKSYFLWLREEIRTNTPWDELTRKIITSRGDSIENGATNFYAVHQDPESMAENVSQAFMGLSIACAKCHNHPLEKWTNNQYYAFANLFARVRAKGWGGDARNGDGKRTLHTVSSGELLQPKTGRHQPAAPLDGAPIPENSERDRREFLADWLTSPENPYFTRAIVNRVWAAFFGVGIVNPVDDLRLSNPASNEMLMKGLCDYLVGERYNLKALMRLILNSDAYQRSSETIQENRDDQRYFSHYYPRRLSAEILSDAISSVTGIPEQFDAIALQDGSSEKTALYPKGFRAVQVYDAAVRSYFLKTFGRNQREITCDCERSNQPSMVQALHLSNGTTINDKLASKNGTVADWIAGNLDDEKLVETAFMTCLSRPPTQLEALGYSKILSEAKPDERRACVEDVMWALLTSREFLFQH
jgi:hypothetical protein